MKITPRACAGTASAVIALLGAYPAFAQQVQQPTETQSASNDTDSGEIVVTAQRREQRLQDVPIAVTALNGDSLRQSGIRSTDQLAGYAPNLSWNQSGSVGSNVGLRGIVDLNITTNQVASVGLVADEVSLNSPVLNTIPIFDIARVEVLRGPQVTLYGRSTTGGAINFYTERPVIGGGLRGYASANYGNYNSVDLEGAVGFDLGSNLAARISGLSQWRDGIFFNPTLGRRVSDRDRQAFRVGLLFEPSSRLSVFANFQYGHDRGGGPYFKSVGKRLPANPALPCAPTTSTPGIDDCVNDAGFKDSPNLNEVFSSNLSSQKVDIYGGLINAKYDFGGVTLSSISSYISNKLQLAYAPDGGPAARGVINNETVTGQFSQELRLSSNGGAEARLNWVAGLYYFNEKQNGSYVLVIRPPSAAGSPPGPQLRSFAFDQKNEIYSGYAQVDWKFAPHFELSIGGRYSEETKGGDGISRWSVNPGFFFSNPNDKPIPGAPIWNQIRDSYPAGTFFSRSVLASLPANLIASTPFGTTWRNAGGKIGLNWQPNSDTLVYASVSKAFKGGTFNTLPAVRLTNPSSRQRFIDGVRPEKLTTYEIGTKLDLFDKILRFNAALFWNDYKDQQQTVFDPESLGLVLANAANATIKGAEVEIELRPARGLLIQTGIGVLDAKYGAFVATPGDPLSDFSGQRVVQASRFSWNALIRKSFALGPGQLIFQSDLKHITPYAYVAENSAPGVYAPLNIAPENTIVNGRIAYDFGEGTKYELALWARNIGNVRYCTIGGSVPFGSGQCGPNEPRTYGVGLRVGF